MEKKVKPNKMFYVAMALIALALISFMIYAALNKKVYSLNEYKEILEKNDYTIEDKSIDYEDNSTIEKYITSKPKKNNFQVDYYKMDSSESAKKFFDDFVVKIEKESNGVKGKTTDNHLGYIKYTTETNNNYIVIVKSDNTIIYINTANKNKESVEELLKELSY